eukprot:5822813-Ditylum_brightwellii.AAC.1
MLLGWDDEICRDQEGDERNIQRGLTKYYKSQDKPPDEGGAGIQTSLNDFFRLNPQLNHHTASA